MITIYLFCGISPQTSKIVDDISVNSLSDTTNLIDNYLKKNIDYNYLAFKEFDNQGVFIRDLTENQIYSEF